jgi:hypothetical protein
MRLIQLNHPRLINASRNKHRLTRVRDGKNRQRSMCVVGTCDQQGDQFSAIMVIGQQSQILKGLYFIHSFLGSEEYECEMSDMKIEKYVRRKRSMSSYRRSYQSSSCSCREPFRLIWIGRLENNMAFQGLVKL